MSAGAQSTRPLAEATPPGQGPPSRLVALGRRVIERLKIGDGTVDHVPPGDALLAGFLAVAALSAHLVRPTEGVPHGSVTGVAGLLLIVVVFAALAWRRVAPGLTMSVSGFGTGAWFLIGHADGFVPLAVMIALYSVAAFGSRADGITSLVVTEFFVLITFVSLMARDVPFTGIQLAVNLLLFLGIWVLGDRTRVRRELLQQLRARAEQAERSRELSTELAVADERGRIARELHDVVAHTVSVMVVQAGAGRRVAASDPERAASTLEAIEAVGRDALADLRRMVDVLRDDGSTEGLAPQPTLDELDELVERLATAGLPVSFRRVGDRRRLPSGVELCGFRIVQEALTNVMKHAGTVREVAVTLRYGEGALVVEVEDDGRGAAGGANGAEPGSGVLGMRERVAVFDGRLQVGPRPNGGFRVRAVLPLPDETRTDQPTRDAPRAGQPANDASTAGRPANDDLPAVPTGHPRDDQETGS